MDEVIASELITTNTFLYGKHILENTFPHPVDGMKKVRRRIIYTQPTEGVFSGQKLLGNTLAIHPYGDMSVYETACRMAEQYRSAFPLLFLRGNSGSYSGDRAAHARYTEFKLTDFCKDILYNGINFKTLPTEQTEDLKGREIAYFIPKIPMALFMSNESVGFGYGSKTLPLKFENICDLTIDFVLCQDKNAWDYSKLVKLFVPHFPIQVKVQNKPELIAEYSKGNFNAPVMTEGLYVIEANNRVVFKTMAFGIAPKSVAESIFKLIKSKTHWIAKEDVIFDDLSSNKIHADFSITIKRGMNLFDLIENIKGIIRVRCAIHPANNFVLNGMKASLDPPDILRIWYKERYRSVFSAKKHRQRELISSRQKYETYLIICEHVDEVISIIRGSGTGENTYEEERLDVYKKLRERFELSIRQCDILLESNLQILMRSKKNELEAKLAKIVTELDELNESFKHIDKEICSDIRQLKKRYKTDLESTSYIAEYIGCLIIGSLGIVNISTIDEIFHFGRIFPNAKLRFIPFHSGVKLIKYSKSINTYNHISALPYTNNTGGISVQYRGLPNIFIRKDGKSNCVKTDNVFLSEGEALFNYTSKNPSVILNNGKITEAPEDLFDTRKHSLNVLYAFDLDPSAQEIIVVSVNEAHSNVLRLQRVDMKKPKVFLSGAGDSAILGVIAADTNEGFFNLPSFHRNSCIHITGIQKHLKSVNLAEVNIKTLSKA